MSLLWVIIQTGMKKTDKFFDDDILASVPETGINDYEIESELFQDNIITEIDGEFEKDFDFEDESKETIQGEKTSIQFSADKFAEITNYDEKREVTEDNVPITSSPVTSLMNLESQLIDTNISSDNHSWEVQEKVDRKIEQGLHSGNIELPLTESEINERMELIRGFVELKKFDRAKSYLTKLLSKSSGIQEAYQILSRIYYEEENWSAFIENWDKYLENEVNRTKENLMMMADALEETEQYDDLILILQEMIEIDSDDNSVLERIVALLLQQEDFEVAVPYLKVLIERIPDDPRYLFHLARAYRQQEKYLLAAVQYQKALEIAETPEIYNELGYTYEKVGKIDAAIESYLKSLDIEPENITANLSLIVLYEKEKDWKNAIEAINRTLMIPALAADRVEILKKKLESIEEILGDKAPEVENDQEMVFPDNEDSFEETTEDEQDELEEEVLEEESSPVLPAEEYSQEIMTENLREKVDVIDNDVYVEDDEEVEEDEDDEIGIDDDDGSDDDVVDTRSQTIVLQKDYRDRLKISPRRRRKRRRR
jgi:tetratricopeptide (TPR) repeat protein